MVDWKNIDANFTEELQVEWESKGFSYEQCKEWIDAGLKATDADYAKWLKDTKKVDAKWTLDHGNNEQLGEEYENYLISKWHNKGFIDEEISAWNSVGLGLPDGGYAAWMRDISKITPAEYFDYLEENNDDSIPREQWQAFLKKSSKKKFFSVLFPLKKRTNNFSKNRNY